MDSARALLATTTVALLLGACSGGSVPVGEDGITPADAPPPALPAVALPTGLKATFNANHSITLDWTPGTDGGIPAAGYLVQARKLGEARTFWLPWHLGTRDTTSTSLVVPDVYGSYQVRVISLRAAPDGSELRSAPVEGAGAVLDVHAPAQDAVERRGVPYAPITFPAPRAQFAPEGGPITFSWTAPTGAQASNDAPGWQFTGETFVYLAGVDIQPLPIRLPDSWSGAAGKITAAADGTATHVLRTPPPAWMEVQFRIGTQSSAGMLYAVSPREAARPSSVVRQGENVLMYWVPEVRRLRLDAAQPDRSGMKLIDEVRPRFTQFKRTLTEAGMRAERTFCLVNVRSSRPELPGKATPQDADMLLLVVPATQVTVAESLGLKRLEQTVAPAPEPLAATDAFVC